jgi:hypothetical protein
MCLSNCCSIWTKCCETGGIPVILILYVRCFNITKIPATHLWGKTDQEIIIPMYFEV